MARSIQKGDRVRIYQKPLTRAEFEEEGTLVNYVGQIGVWQGERFERWLVRFDGEAETFERVVGANEEVLTNG